VKAIEVQISENESGYAFLSKCEGGSSSHAAGGAGDHGDAAHGVRRHYQVGDVVVFLIIVCTLEDVEEKQVSVV